MSLHFKENQENLIIDYFIGSEITLVMDHFNQKHIGLNLGLGLNPFPSKLFHTLNRQVGVLQTYITHYIGKMYSTFSTSIKYDF